MGSRKVRILCTDYTITCTEASIFRYRSTGAVPILGVFSGVNSAGGQIKGKGNNGLVLIWPKIIEKLQSYVWISPKIRQIE